MSNDTDIRTEPVVTEQPSVAHEIVANVSGDAHKDFHDASKDTPQQLSRRRFLSALSWALVGAGGLVVAVPVVGYIIGPLIKDSKQTDNVWRQVGPVSQFKIGDTVEVKFADASPLPWAGVVAQTAAWLRRDSDTQFTAFAVNCTHLGCPVSWLPGASLFMCPCHGGVYYATGEVAAGPPPAKLPQYQWRINKGQVEIKASGLPVVQQIF